MKAAAALVTLSSVASYAFPLFNKIPCHTLILTGEKWVKGLLTGEFEVLNYTLANLNLYECWTSRVLS